jgi:hypothetical protein
MEQTFSKISGQVYVEAILAAPLIIASVSLFFVLIYGTFSSLITHHRLYEMLICSQNVPKPSHCVSDAKKDLSNALLIGKLIRLVVHEDPTSSRVQAEILLPLSFHLVINESIQLPLQAGS